MGEDANMSRVILDISMSLDGLIAQPDDDPGPIHEFYFSGENEHDVVFRTSGATTEVVRESIDSAGAVITGRRTYDLTHGWEGNHPMRVPCFVVTHDVPTEVPVGTTHFTFVTDGIESAVRQAKAVAGEKDVSIIGGASIARQVLGARLLDEIQIHLSPVILGDGIRLFESLDTGRIRLEQLHVIQAPGVTHLRYAVHS
jgi:dihydrofolate reductase